MGSKVMYECLLKRLIEPFQTLYKNPTNPQDVFIPALDPSDVVQICSDVKSIFANEPSLLMLQSPIVVFGDIHGHTLDLARFYDSYINNEKYSKSKFLFLGDLVDRGSFCIESCLIVFLLILLNPKSVFSIRGNHEFDAMCKEHGFFDQLMGSYLDEKIYQVFVDAFDQMPFGAKIDNNILCIHGGISQNLFSVDQIKRFQRPYHNFTNKLIDDLLWGDPDDNGKQPFVASDRGFGYFFTEEPLSNFLFDNRLELLVRAHECVVEGCQYSLKGKCLTVFSASCYCGVIKNKAGVLIVESPIKRRTEEFEALPYLQRDMVTVQTPVSSGPVNIPSSNDPKSAPRKKLASSPSRVRGLTLTPL